jgi:RNA polymerase sigma factor (sigma-70 family)
LDRHERATHRRETEAVAFEELLLAVGGDGSLDRMLRALHRSLAFVIDFDDYRQEVLLRAWEARAQFQGDSPEHLKRYLWVVSRRLLLDLLRRHTAAAKIQHTPDAEPAAAKPDRSLGVLETREWVRWLIAGLNAKEQELLRKVYWQHQTLQAVAADWGCSYRAVVQAHFRALEKLRGRLDKP